MQPNQKGLIFQSYHPPTQNILPYKMTCFQLLYRLHDGFYYLNNNNLKIIENNKHKNFKFTINLYRIIRSQPQL